MDAHAITYASTIDDIFPSQETADRDNSSPTPKRIRMQEELFTQSDLSARVEIESGGSLSKGEVIMDDQCCETIDFEVNSAGTKQKFNFSKRRKKFKDKQTLDRKAKEKLRATREGKDKQCEM